MWPRHNSSRFSGADDRDWTGDLILTKDTLCRLSYISLFWSGRRESNPHDRLGRPGLYPWATPARLVVGAGFEPAKAVLADLQSAPFGQLGYPTSEIHLLRTFVIIAVVRRKVNCFKKEPLNWFSRQNWKNLAWGWIVAVACPAFDRLQITVKYNIVPFIALIKKGDQTIHDHDTIFIGLSRQ